MNAETIPTVRLRNPWRSNHPWIFQKLVEKPATKPKPGSIVDIVGVDGEWIGRGFYNGHSRVALRILEADRDIDVDAAWIARKIAAAGSLRRPAGGRILQRRHVPPPRMDLRRAARAVSRLPLPCVRRRARAEAGVV